MASRIAFRQAEDAVTRFRSEADGLMDDHRQAMDCRDCEDFLKLGIDAFDWLLRADKVVREAILSGSDAIDYEDVEKSILTLCRRWLVPCQRAAEWAAIQLERGYRVDNLDQFKACCAEMRAIVDAQDESHAELSVEIAQLRDQAIEEHRNGQTAEFI